jgi:hypothetical protein
MSMKSLKRIGRWIRRQTKNRPFATALVVMIIVVSPGFLRLENIADTANEAASSAKTLATERVEEAKRDAEKLKEETLIGCQTRNTFQQNVRVKFARFIDAIELAFVSSARDPEQAGRTRAFINQLRDAVETRPEGEDRDCNDDSKIDDADYLPA